MTPVSSEEPSLTIRISSGQSPEANILVTTLLRLPEQLNAGITIEIVTETPLSKDNQITLGRRTANALENEDMRISAAFPREV